MTPSSLGIVTWSTSAILLERKSSSFKRFKYVPTTTLGKNYFSSIVPTITYCSLVWGTSSPSLMTELEHIHARASKTFHRLSWDISVQEALESTRWEPLSNQYRKKLITLMYKVNSNTTPAKITNLFSITHPRYYLRNRYNLDIARNSLRYRGPLVWEPNSNIFQRVHSLKNFKNRLKQSHHKIFINNLSFLKEACMISHKNQDFKYF